MLLKTDVAQAAGGARLIRGARAQDLPAVLALLAEAKLPAEGVAEFFDSFLVAEDDGRLVGCAGVELHGEAALLRSLAVAADVRGAGLGAALLRRALEEAHRRAVAVYALTTTAEGYLARFGFERIPRASLPARLFESRQLQDACPVSAVVMKSVRR